MISGGMPEGARNDFKQLLQTTITRLMQGFYNHGRVRGPGKKTKACDFRILGLMHLTRELMIENTDILNFKISEL